MMRRKQQKLRIVSRVYNYNVYKGCSIYIIYIDTVIITFTFLQNATTQVSQTWRSIFFVVVAVC